MGFTSPLFVFILMFMGINIKNKNLAGTQNSLIVIRGLYHPVLQDWLEWDGGSKEWAAYAMNLENVNGILDILKDLEEKGSIGDQVVEVTFISRGDYDLRNQSKKSNLEVLKEYFAANPVQGSFINSIKKQLASKGTLSQAQIQAAYKSLEIPMFEDEVAANVEVEVVKEVQKTNQDILWEKCLAILQDLKANPHKLYLLGNPFVSSIYTQTFRYLDLKNKFKIPLSEKQMSVFLNQKLEVLEPTEDQQLAYTKAIELLDKGNASDKILAVCLRAKENGVVSVNDARFLLTQLNIPSTKEQEGLKDPTFPNGTVTMVSVHFMKTTGLATRNIKLLKTIKETDKAILAEYTATFEFNGYHCAMCGRKLTNAVSKVYGIGPECCTKMGLTRLLDVNDAKEIFATKAKEMGLATKKQGWLPKAMLFRGLAKANQMDEEQENENETGEEEV